MSPSKPLAVASAFRKPANPSTGPAPTRRHRAVAFHSVARQDGHRLMATRNVARCLAELLGLPFESSLPSASTSPAFPAEVGSREAGASRTLDRYLVPDESLLVSEAAALGIRDEADFFGGIVTHPFVATKCVSHGLVSAQARRPAGWADTLAGRLEGVVLPGYSTFSVEDAREATRRMIDRYGPIRLKAAAATGGSGQSVHDDIGSAQAWIDGLSAHEVQASGLVIEANLEEEATWSIGTVRVGTMAAAYYGTQCTTADNHGRTVYGGSTLHVVRGGWDELIAASMPAAAREAALLARRYHDAMFEAFPGMMASRCNYDVMTGRGADGRRWTGVLEQSWRIGGASGAECAALLAFRDEPTRERIEASTHEVYGDGACAPAGTQVHFQGHDPDVGPILKYVDLKR